MAPMKTITNVAPRCAAFQVMRYVDGPAVLLTSTRRGVLQLHEEKVEPTAHPQVYARRWTRARESDHQQLLLARVIAAGYDPIAVGDDVRKRAMTKPR